MLDKIRLQAAGQLPQDYQGNDGHCRRFLGVRYSEIGSRTLAGEADESVLTWAHAHGTPRTDDECHVWTVSSPSSAGATNAATSSPSASGERAYRQPIETLIDHIEFREGRDPVDDRSWEKSEKI